LNLEHKKATPMC